MHIMVVGLGVIGTGYGWVFSDAGHQVSHLVRKGRAAGAPSEIAIDLLDTRGGAETVRKVTYRPAVTETAAGLGTPDLIMVPVKHYQLVDTVRELRQALPDTRLLLFAATWEGVEEVDGLLGPDDFAWGYSSATGGHGGDELVLNLSPDYRCGPLHGVEPSWAGDVTDLFASAGIRPDRKPDMADWLLVHFAQAAGTIGTALAVGGQQELLEDEAALRELCVPAVRECFAVLAARGVDAALYPEAAPFLTQPAEVVAAGMVGSAARLWVQRTFRAGHFGENQYEMKRFYSDVLETGLDLGVDMPVMLSIRERIAAL